MELNHQRNLESITALFTVALDKVITMPSEQVQSLALAVSNLTPAVLSATTAIENLVTRLPSADDTAAIAEVITQIETATAALNGVVATIPPQ